MTNSTDIVLRNDTLLSMSFVVRIYVDKLDDDFVAIQLHNKERYRLSRIAAYVLIFFSGGETVQDVFEKVSIEFDLSNEEYIGLLNSFLTSELLVFAKDSSNKSLYEKSAKWLSNGWVEALDYNLLTTDYPFLDYASTDSWAEDVDRMQQYRGNSKEPSRYKDALDNIENVKCKNTQETLKALSSPINDIFSQNFDEGKLDINRLKSIVSCSLGILRKRPVPNHPEIEPFIRKTSPSGGSRHPTEGYVINLSIEGISKGLHSFSPQHYSLQSINDECDLGEIRNNLEGVFRADFEPKAIVVLTSVFKRNMYRYREPRTFRTIFIDAGHVASTIEMVSRSLKVKSFVQHGINDKWFEEYANISALKEGAILGIALA